MSECQKHIPGLSRVGRLVTTWVWPVSDTRYILLAYAHDVLSSSVTLPIVTVFMGYRLDSERWTEPIKSSS